MTTLILYGLLWLWDHRTFDSITKANERKVAAQKAYEEKNYKGAAALYNQIVYGSVFSEPAARLNLAHAYFQSEELDNALKQYQLLLKVDDPMIASIANSQAALIKVNNTDTAAALGHLKKALMLEPGNDVARLNYIQLKKAYSGKELLPERKNQKKHSDNQLTNQPNEIPQPPLSEEQKVEQSAKKEQLLSSLKAMNMSEEQAKAILDAMKSNESQYIYQLRRKQYAKQSNGAKQIEW
jgi:tetratricopeptide (TPR) repeat protein